MRLGSIVGSGLAGAVLLVWAAHAREKDGRRPRESPPAPATQLERGEYLVRHVAKCVDCHTPRNDKGQLDAGRLLQGGPIWIKPAVPTDEWARSAPDITASGKAGKWREEKMVKLLTRGEREASPPMPVFRMTADDAKAVYAYLRSLPGKASR